jgi:hypothetical protein
MQVLVRMTQGMAGASESAWLRPFCWKYLVVTAGYTHASMQNCIGTRALITNMVYTVFALPPHGSC